MKRHGPVAGGGDRPALRGKPDVSVIRTRRGLGGRPGPTVGDGRPGDRSGGSGTYRGIARRTASSPQCLGETSVSTNEAKADRVPKPAKIQSIRRNSFMGLALTSFSVAKGMSRDDRSPLVLQELQGLQSRIYLFRMPL